MRLLEVLAEPIRAVGSKRFHKSLAFYAKGYPGLKQRLDDFVKAKIESPTTPWDKKDYAFTAGPIKGIGHAHLVHGKVLLIYLVVGNEIRLFDLVEHDVVENNAMMTALAKYVASARDFTTYEPEPEPVDVFADQVREAFADLITSPQVLADVRKGKVDEAIEIISLFVEADAEAILAVFGGRDGMAKAAEDLLRDNNYHYLLKEVSGSDLYSKSFADFRRRYGPLVGDKSLYVNFTDAVGNTLDKSFSPKPDHRDPVGLYAYPLEYVLNHPADIQYGQQARFLRVVRDRSKAKLVLTTMTQPQALDILTRMNIEDPKRRMGFAARTAKPISGNVVAKTFYQTVQWYAQGGKATFTPNAMQTALFRKAGIDAIEDVAKSRSEAIIYPDEPEQIVFLTRAAFEIVDVYELRTPRRRRGSVHSHRPEENFKRLPGLIAQGIGDRIVANNVGIDTKGSMSFYTAEKRKITVSMDNAYRWGEEHRKLADDTPERVTVTLMGPDFKTIRQTFPPEATFEQMAAAITKAFAERTPAKGRSFDLMTEYGPAVRKIIDIFAALAKKTNLPFTKPTSETVAFRVFLTTKAIKSIPTYPKTKELALQHFKKNIERFWPGNTQPQGAEMLAIYAALLNRKGSYTDLFHLEKSTNLLGIDVGSQTDEDFAETYGDITFFRRGTSLLARLGGKEHVIATIEDNKLDHWNTVQVNHDQRVMLPYAEYLADYLNEHALTCEGYKEYLVANYDIVFDGEEWHVASEFLGEGDAFGDVRIKSIPSSDPKRPLSSVVAIVDGETDFGRPAGENPVEKWRKAVWLMTIDDNGQILSVSPMLVKWKNFDPARSYVAKNPWDLADGRVEQDVWKTIIESGFDLEAYVDSKGWTPTAADAANALGMKINLDTGKTGKTFKEVLEPIGTYEGIELFSIRTQRDALSAKMRYFAVKRDGEFKQVMSTTLDWNNATIDIEIGVIADDMTIEERKAIKALIAERKIKVPTKFKSRLATR